MMYFNSRSYINVSLIGSAVKAFINVQTNKLTVLNIKESPKQNWSHLLAGVLGHSSCAHDSSQVSQGRVLLREHPTVSSLERHGVRA